MNFLDAVPQFFLFFQFSRKSSLYGIFIYMRNSVFFEFSKVKKSLFMINFDGESENNGHFLFLKLGHNPMEVVHDINSMDSPLLDNLFWNRFYKRLKFLAIFFINIFFKHKFTWYSTSHFKEPNPLFINIRTRTLFTIYYIDFF